MYNLNFLFAHVAQAHFGPEGLGSDFSGNALRIVDSLTWIGIVIGVTMVVRIIQKKRQT